MRYVVAVLAALFLLLPAFAVRAQDPNADLLWEIVVELRADQDPATVSVEIVSDILRDGSDPAKRINHLYTHAITGFSVFVTEDEYNTLMRKHPSGPTAQVLGVTRSQAFSIGMTLVNAESNFPVTEIADGTQVVPTGVQRVEADGATLSAGNVDVAVVDTGVDGLHEDLNVVGGVDCTSTIPTLAGGAPPADAPKETWDVDDVGHGTHVAGIVGAKDNGEGVVGVAPGARIWSVKVLDASGSGSTGSVICGLDWLVEHADTVDVANLSLGGGGYTTACGESDPMHNAMCAVTDVMPVAVAAGNSTMDSSSFSPANYAEVVTVAAIADFDGQPGGGALTPKELCSALSRDDALAAYSNYGDGVDIAAPGTCLLSTIPGNTDAGGTYHGGNYGYLSGTSMATPMVTGALARFLAENPDQRRQAPDQLLFWAEAHGEGIRDPFTGEITMPLLYVGSGFPRSTD